PNDVNRCTVDVTGSGLHKVADVPDMFALAQFQDMDDAAKLSRPSFERQTGGIELAADGTALASARAVRRSARYEQIVIDTSRRSVDRFTAYSSGLFAHLMGGNSVSRSTLSQAQQALRQPFTEHVRVGGDTFTVAGTLDNKAVGTHDGAAPVFASAALAHDRLADLLAEDPSLAGTLHVIPTVEAQ
ncbi:hypothetical protein AB0K09_20580, partial [Streptomyces sp. NPDC049577]